MSLLRTIGQSLRGAAAVALLSAAVSPLAAQRQLFEWSGRVDRDIQITMRGRDAVVSDGRYGTTNGRISTENTLPRDEGRVEVRVERGRANAWVVQQPSRSNGYTTIVRVRDAGRDNGMVRLQAYWRGDSDWRYGSARDDRNNGGVWSNSRGDDNDGSWGRSGSTALRWSGEVDDAVEIRIRGDRISYRTLSGNGLRNVRADDFRGLPNAEADVSVASRDGRGTVDVVEQPSARNGYTTVIRVYDPNPGSDRYAFTLQYRERGAIRRF